MRVREGMPDIVEHVALEPRNWLGCSGLWSYSRDRYPGVYQVVIEYLDEEAGRYAARAAVRLCQPC